jgi:predicted acylesterase/phospholipase RssA
MTKDPDDKTESNQPARLHESTFSDPRLMEYLTRDAGLAAGHQALSLVIEELQAQAEYAILLLQNTIRSTLSKF